LAVLALAAACFGGDGGPVAAGGGPDRLGAGLRLAQDLRDARTDLVACAEARWELPVWDLWLGVSGAAHYSLKRAYAYTVDLPDNSAERGRGSGKWNKLEAEAGLWWEPRAWVELGTGLGEVIVNDYDDDSEAFGEVTFFLPLPEVLGKPFHMEVKEENFYSLSEEQSARNEVSLGMWLEVTDDLETGLVHKHIDLVEGPDTDEISLALWRRF